MFASRLLGAVLAFASLASCTITSKGPGGEISKVKYYYLNTLFNMRTEEPAIIFEREHHLHGAYTAAEQIARTGHYYVVMWRAYDRSQPVTVRLEYRQANTALQVKTLEQQVTDVRRRNQTHFQVTGSEFQAGGRVTAWRVSLLRGKEELASQQSYLWK